MATNNNNEYLSVPVYLDESRQIVGYLHILPHKSDVSKEEDELRPSGRTLFVAGLPYGFLEEELRTVFSSFGGVDDVLVSTVGGSKVAHVVFEAPQGLKKVLSCARKGLKAAALPTHSSQSAPETGLKKWVAEHQAARPGNEVLRKKVDLWMAGWEREQERMKAEAAEQQAAEEGWTLVTSRKKTVSASGVVVGGLNKTKATSIGSNVKEKAKLEDFYRFQRREKHRGELLALREQFEEDKKKIAKLKAARKFKPY